jgi:ubiquinone/menaquinone biosynthesis C-methylase UbiE
MSDPLTRMATRVAYAATQLPRLVWYAGHGYVMRRLAAQARRNGAPRRDDASAGPAQPARAPAPDQWSIYADLGRLLAQDLANVEAGLYPLPHDHDGALPTRLRRSRLFFDDLPAIHRRRERNGWREVLTEATAGRRPDYYLQNFHYQSGGWLSEDSADRYDTQVEVLFKGSANAMRRQALPPLHEVFAGRDQRRLRLIDIACGTGRFLDFAKQTWPRLSVVGLDLSDAYCRHARDHLRRWSRVDLVVGNAEAIPAPDESFDAATCIFTFHELPPEARRNVMRECARVLKPGGRLVLLDSLQRGDAPDYDGMLERFPQDYHEPYYGSYIGEDFPAIAGRFGLTHQRDVKAFVSKVMVFDKVIRSLAAASFPGIPGVAAVECPATGHSFLHRDAK